MIAQHKKKIGKVYKQDGVNLSIHVVDILNNAS